MTSQTTKQFRKLYAELPEHIKKQAREAYHQWKNDPFHSSLQFKQVHTVKPVFSVRIGLGWRALGVRRGDLMIWYWIGSHADYDDVLRKL